MDILDTLLAQRVVPVLRFASAELTERAVHCIVHAGYKSVEITMTVPGAIEVIRRLARSFSSRLVVGAGTVLDLDTAMRCMDAGARFIVSPGLVPSMARAGHDAQCAVLCGGFTPTEIWAAHCEGADVVKVFPASTGGPKHVRALHAVYPQVLLCPTGGVSFANMDAYFKAGAAMVGIGEDIVDGAALQAGDDAQVVEHARRFLSVPS